jgi:endoglucanase
MAQTYGNKDNVIFEIYNEPDGESWSQIKTYAQEVIGAIRATGSDNLIVVGTPTWSQDVDQAANSPITGFSNIAYTLHFYAGTHKQSLRDKATYALSKGIPLFVTEFGTCDASGNGNLDLTESQTWMNFMNTNKLSWANWSLFDKNETASALVPGASTTGNWTDSSLTASGKWVKQKMLEASGGGSSPPPPPPPPSSTFQFTVSPNINPWWIQVKVENPGHTIKSVSAKVSTSTTYALQLQSWGEWTYGPPAPVPGGTQVLFTATDETGAQGTYTSAPWPY